MLDPSFEIVLHEWAVLMEVDGTMHQHSELAASTYVLAETTFERNSWLSVLLCEGFEPFRNYRAKFVDACFDPLVPQFYIWSGLSVQDVVDVDVQLCINWVELLIERNLFSVTQLNHYFGIVNRVWLSEV